MSELCQNSELSGNDANCRHADQEVPISGPGVIAVVGNGDGQDDSSYQGDRRKLFQGLVVVRTSRQSGPIAVMARTPGLRDGSVMIQVTAVAERPELRLANPQKSELFVSGRGSFQMSCQATREPLWLMLVS